MRSKRKIWGYSTNCGNELTTTVTRHEFYKRPGSSKRNKRKQNEVTPTPTSNPSVPAEKTPKLVKVLTIDGKTKYDPEKHINLSYTNINETTFYARKKWVTVLKRDHSILYNRHAHHNEAFEKVPYSTWNGKQLISVLKNNNAIRYDENKHGGQATVKITKNEWQACKKKNKQMLVLKTNWGVLYDPDLHHGQEPELVSYYNWRANQPIEVLKENIGVRYEPALHLGQETESVPYHKWYSHKQVLVLKDDKGTKYNFNQHLGRESMLISYLSWQSSKNVVVLADDHATLYNENLHQGKNIISIPRHQYAETKTKQALRIHDELAPFFKTSQITLADDISLEEINALLEDEEISDEEELFMSTHLPSNR